MTRLMPFLAEVFNPQDHDSGLEFSVYAGLYLGGLATLVMDERWRELIWRAWWPF